MTPHDYRIISNKGTGHTDIDWVRSLHDLLQPVTTRPTETRSSFYLDHQVSHLRVSTEVGGVISQPAMERLIGGTLSERFPPKGIRYTPSGNFFCIHTWGGGGAESLDPWAGPYLHGEPLDSSAILFISEDFAHRKMF